MRGPLAAAGRARWLAEVAQALDEAKETVRALGVTAGGEYDRLELIERIDTALEATRMLRLRCDRRLERGNPPL